MSEDNLYHLVDFDWSLKWIFGSNILATQQEPLINLIFHVKNPDQPISGEEKLTSHVQSISTELNQKDLQNLISVLEQMSSMDTSGEKMEENGTVHEDVDTMEVDSEIGEKSSGVQNGVSNVITTENSNDDTTENTTENKEIASECGASTSEVNDATLSETSEDVSVKSNIEDQVSDISSTNDQADIVSKEDPIQAEKTKNEEDNTHSNENNDMNIADVQNEEKDSKEEVTDNKNQDDSKEETQILTEDNLKEVPLDIEDAPKEHITNNQIENNPSDIANKDKCNEEVDNIGIKIEPSIENVLDEESCITRNDSEPIDVAPENKDLKDESLNESNNISLKNNSSILLNESKIESGKSRRRRNLNSKKETNANLLPLWWPPPFENDFPGFSLEYRDSTIQMYQPYVSFVRNNFDVDCSLPNFKSNLYVQPENAAPAAVINNKRKVPVAPMKIDKDQTSLSNKKRESSIKKEIITPPKKEPTKIKINGDYKIPLFKYGWRREVIYRSSSNCNTADIYYYTPNGKKFRSVREILDFIPHDSELKAYNFSFVREPLGFDPPYEVSRTAYARTLLNSSQSTPKRINKTSNTNSSRKVFFNRNTANKFNGGTKSNTLKKPYGIKDESSDEDENLANLYTKKCLETLGNKTTEQNSKGKSIDTNSRLKNVASKSPKDSPAPVRTKQTPTKTRQSGNKKTIKRSHADENSDVISKQSISPESKKRKLNSSNDISLSVRNESPTSIVKQIVGTRKIVYSNKHIVNDINNQFKAIVKLCSYLRLDDLLRVARVNSIFNAAAHHYTLWQTVKLKNCKVSNWGGLADCLIRHRTHTLDMMKMIGSTNPDDNEDMWNKFYTVIGNVHSLKRIELGRVSGVEILNCASNCSKNLTEFSVIALKSATIDLKLFRGLPNLESLQMRSFETKRDFGLIMMNIPLLSNMRNLRHLSLTGVRNLQSYQVGFLKDFPPLESLELGYCTKLDDRFPEFSLAHLKSLKRLRLEILHGSFANKCLEAIATLPELKTLELINIDAKEGFDEVFGKLTNVENMLLFPTYVTQSSTTNWYVLSGIGKLRHTLKYLTWGLTHELLQVTNLFIEQWSTNKNADESSKEAKSGGELNSIPFMKPLPEYFEEIYAKIGNSNTKQNIAAELDILPINKLKIMLETVLENTKVKLVTVPAAAALRMYLPK